MEEDIIIPYIDHPNVAIINFLSDAPGGYSYGAWGSKGDDRIPLIVNDYDYGQMFGNWFGISWSSPWYLILDENFVLKYKTQSESEAKEYLEEFLSNME